MNNFNLSAHQNPLSNQPVAESQIFHIGALRRAISEQELSLHYQPRYNSCSGKLVTVEALARWQHPKHGLLYPESFLPFAVEVDLINPLGLWVFERCCNDLFYIRNHLGHDVKISINLSISQCEDPHFTQNILDICHKYYLSLSCFEFEIKGCSAIYNRNEVISFCYTLAEIGASFSLEDFGIGLSSLDNLCELPVDLLKIDTNSVKKIGYCRRTEILTKNLIKLAHDLQASIVAQGVEHTYQRDFLIDNGCDQLQGFLMHKPVELDKLNCGIVIMPA